MFSTLTRRGRSKSASAPAAQSAESFVSWQRMLDPLQANVIMADADFNIIYANPKSVKTLQNISSNIRESFGVEINEIVGGSIHRFHKDPAAIERILRSSHSLPHEAEFSFGEITLKASINSVKNSDGEVFGYIVNWDDVSYRIEQEAKAAQLTSMVECMPINMIFAD